MESADLASVSLDRFLVVGIAGSRRRARQRDRDSVVVAIVVACRPCFV